MIFCRLRLDRRDRQADRHPRPADPGRPRRRVPAVARRSRPTSGRWCSSARSSTTPTSCRGASRSPTSSSIPEDARRPHRPGRARGASWSSYADRPLKIGSFSAASNVTGIVTDTHARSPTCCTATARCRSGTSPPPAPYVEIEMYGRCDEHPQAYKDAVFLSPHKFVGGPGTPGVLVVRRELLRNRVPTVPGRRHGRLRQPVRAPLPRRPGPPRGGRHAGDRRVDPRRAGVPAQGGRRRRRDPGPARSDFLRRAIAAWRAQPEHRDPRQPRRRAAVDRVLRGAPAGRPRTCTTTSSWRCSTTCSASSPAAAARAPARTGTGCSASTSTARTEFEREIVAGCEGIKPGWVRVNFNYFISEAVFDYIVDAVDLVADARLAAAARLPVRPVHRAVAAPRRAGRAAAAARPGRATTPTGELRCPRARTSGPARSALAGYLAEARALFAQPAGAARADDRAGQPRCRADFEHLRWFELPGGEPGRARRLAARPPAPWTGHTSAVAASIAWLEP